MMVPRHSILPLAALLFASAAQAQNPPARPAQPPAPPARPAPSQPAPAPAPRPDTTAIRAREVADSVAAQAESLAARLQRAEDAIEQLRTQAQNVSKLDTRLGTHVTISGLVLFNAYRTDARVNNADVPQFVALPQDSSGVPNSYAGLAVRQTRLGVTVSDVRALGGGLGADLQMDFYGGSLGERTNPLLRIRTATARIDWPHIGLMVGQDKPLVSPVNPVSFASSGFPEFAGSGNLWLWIPQARVTFEMGRSFRVGVQGAALAPPVPTTTLIGFPADSSDVANRSGRTSIEGRIYFDWGDGDLESQVGGGMHRGWYATTGDTLLASEAYTADARIAIGQHVLLLGEAFFQGQALAGLGGGGIGQNFGVGGVPVRTQGGWVQLDLRPTFAWEIGGGYGMDDPNDLDLNPATGRAKNVVIEGHLHWRPGGGLLLGTEYRRITTSYAPGDLSANHINVFAGVAF